MRLSLELNDAFNQQILREYGNMLVYKRMQNYFENLQLKKIASYFKKQSDHEKDHADIFIDHLNDRTGGIVIIPEIASPPYEIKDLNDIGKIYVLVEEQTTNSIESILDLAISMKSYVDLPLLHKMLEEQVSEEDEANEFMMKLANVKDIVLFDATLS